MWVNKGRSHLNEVVGSRTWGLWGLFIWGALAGDMCGCCMTLCGQGCMATRGLCGHCCMATRGLCGHDCMATRGLWGVGWGGYIGLGLTIGRKLCKGLEANGNTCIGLPGLCSMGLSRCKGCDGWHLIGLWPPVESNKLLGDWLLFSATCNQNRYTSKPWNLCTIFLYLMIEFKKISKW